MSNSVKTIFLSEIILVLAMVIGIISQDFSYLILILLLVSFIGLNLLDSLKLFILSIPFFVALPANIFSDSMSIWRILILGLVLKVCQKKYKNSYFKFIRRIKVKEYKSFRFNIWDNIKKILKNKVNKLFFITFLFFIIVLCSLFFAHNIGSGIKKILFLLNIIFLFSVVIFSIKKENDFLEIFKTIFLSFGLIVFIGYFQFLLTFFISLSQFWYFWTDNVIKVFYGQNLSNLLSYSNTWFSYYESSLPTLRMFSVLPDSHSFAMIIIISIPVILSFFYILNKKRKYLFVVLLVFFLALFFSGSRGAWVGSIFSLFAGLFLFLSSSLKLKNNSKFGKLYFLLLEFIKLLKSKVNFNLKNDSKYYSKLIIFSVLSFFILMPVSSLILKKNQEVQLIRSETGLENVSSNKLSMFERAFSITDFSETSNKGRLQIWKETLDSISQKPFFGVGFGNFNYVLGENSTALKKGSSAHSLYLDIAAETGLFGLFLFLFLILEILKMSYGLYFSVKKEYLKIFTGSFFVYFIWVCAYGLFDVVILNDKVLMFVVILIGLLYSVDRIIDR